MTPREATQDTEGFAETDYDADYVLFLSTIVCSGTVFGH